MDLGLPTVVGAVVASGRGEWAPRAYEVQLSLDGQRWATVGSEVDAPKSDTITAVTPTQARYVRLRITQGYPSQPGHNTQLAEFAVYSDPRPGGR